MSDDVVSMKAGSGSEVACLVLGETGGSEGEGREGVRERKL